MPAEQLVELVTIADVELLEVGEWECSTGTLICTVDDIAACVAAQDDPAVRTPIIKLGHVDPRFDGEPSVGRVENLRLSADRMTLIGDLVGVPKWLAEIIPSAFPSRSIEATKSYTTNTGTSHPMVLTALALLGVSVPAIETLEDIQSLYGVVAAAAPDGRGDEIVIRPKGAAMPPEPVRASVSIDQVRAEFYETQPPGSWAWIREVWSDFIIVDNDAGDLYRIPWSEGANQEVEFGTPERVQVEYVPAPADDDATDTTLVLMGRYNPRSSSKTKSKASKTVPQPIPEEGLMDPKELRIRLGLAEDATDDEVLTALVTHVPDPAAPPDPVVTPAPTTAALPEGVVAIDSATLEDLKVAASQGRQAHESLRSSERDRYLEGAVKAGKFPPARREHYAAMYDHDEKGTREFVDKLAAGTIPLSEIGHGANPEGDISDDVFYREFFGNSPEFVTDTKGA